MASGHTGDSAGLEYSTPEGDRCVLKITFTEEVTQLSCSISTSHTEKLVGGGEGIGQIIYNVF